MKRVLVTGGAGFVGSSLAIRLRQAHSGLAVTAFDNLRRRGSELILSQLRDHGVKFVHGDVRVREDLSSLGPVDLILECAAEPSVLAGLDGSPDYVIQTNLNGTINCLELARRHGADVVFLSTSRVYPAEPINSLRHTEAETRFILEDDQAVPGASRHGISEEFPLIGTRSIYGASKLSSELLLQEYIASYGIRGIVNRSSVLTGPWQMGKVDQGVVVLWVARHIYKQPLSYIGFEGTGKQVRDILHIRDLCDLILLEIERLDELNGETFNVGGGAEISVSLLELTELCRDHTGNTIEISPVAENRPLDLRSYISDCRKLEARTGWKPRIALSSIIGEITAWIQNQKEALKPVLAEPVDT